MKPEPITLFDLFEKQRRYLVPLFQRGYVWTEAGQWEPLWLDILDQVRAIRQHSGDKRVPVRKHFMGAVVLNQVSTGIRQIAAADVIDGQQRLTTLQVLLIAFRDVVANSGSEYLVSTLDRMTINPGPFKDDDERFKVWPTSAYRDDIRSVMTLGSITAVQDKYPLLRIRYTRKMAPRPRLVEAYIFFGKKVSEYLQVNDELDSDTNANEGSIAAPLNTERAEELLDALKGYVQLVAIHLEPEDDPQVIFEALNYRSVPLEPSDLVRNFIFLYATRHGEDVEDLYKRFWHRFDASDGKVEFWKQQERQGRYKKGRLDLFLFHYLTAQTEREIKIGHIFQEFRDWWESSPTPRDSADTLERLCMSSDTFRALLVPDRTSRFGIFARRLRTLDTTTVYPLVLWLAEADASLLASEFDSMLHDIESYLVRRAVCNLTPKNYNRVFLGLLSKLRAAGPPSRATLLAELAAFEGESSVWPSDEAFREALLHNPLYEQMGSQKTQMLLEAIDLALQTNKQEALHLDTTWMSVEHILPQSYSMENWPYPPESVDGVGRAFARLRSLHTLGNLTLITQYLNSAVSNGPFSSKRHEIALQSRLALNAYFQRFANTDTWNEETILLRGAELADVAIRVWSRPSQ